MSAFATGVGYLAIGAAVSFVILIALALVYAYFPARWQFSRDLPTHLDTPHGPLRLTAMVGVSSRRKSRWFFGLMLMKSGEAPRAKVIARKSSAAAREAKPTLVTATVGEADPGVPQPNTNRVGPV